MAYNGFGLCEEADYGTQNCQYSTKAYAIEDVQLTMKPAFLQNPCYANGLLSSVSI
jgi:hypothetical protein